MAFIGLDTGVNRGCSVPAGMTRAKGYIKNVNTIEEFKNTDKSAMITDAGRQVRVQPSDVLLFVLVTDTLTDLGGNPGWHHLLSAVAPLFVRRPLVCRPEEVSLHVLVCISSPSFGPLLEAGRAGWTHVLAGEHRAR